jgi:DNA recombination protein RmuC
MEGLTIVALVFAAAGSVAALWLALGRGGLLARAAAADTARQRADEECQRLKQEISAERDRAAGELSRLQRVIDETGSRLSGAQSEAARLSAQICAAEERYESELRAIEQRHSEREAGMERERQAREAELRSRLAELNTRFRDEFEALAGRTLRTANEEFLKRAEAMVNAERQKAAAEIELKKAAVDQLIRPISETLEKTGQKLAELDKARIESASMLGEHLRAVADGNSQLREETSKLVRALREPHVRGRYGEVQLRRVAELAGMQAYCDFSEQNQTVDADGNALRPDMVVRLPSERVIVVDAKTNIQAYLDALQASDTAEAETHLERFAKHVADQAAALSRKKYWAQYSGSPEFVVMFIPGDQFIDAALSRQPELLENAARQHVLLAGPATLIGLLRAVAVGYREQTLAVAATELRELGLEFHKRAATAYEHIEKMGGAIESVVQHYNRFVASYQGRLEPVLRRFEDAGARSGKDLPEVAALEARPHTVHLPFPEPAP